MNACIRFDGVSKSYGDNRILDNFSLEIPAGTTTALVGESGSGKSTLLMLSNGLIQADAGQVTVLGENVAETNLTALRRRTGYAVQGAGLFPHLTVQENITLVAGLSGHPETETTARMFELFDMMELNREFCDRYPHSLSGGQQQRVSLCRAMLLNPPLLLLDEPFSALDPLTRAAIHQEFLHIQQKESRSILLVTHDMQEAARLATYLVILKDGQVVQSGQVEDVLSSPGDDYVRLLLKGSAP